MLRRGLVPARKIEETLGFSLILAIDFQIGIGGGEIWNLFNTIWQR